MTWLAPRAAVAEPQVGAAVTFGGGSVSIGERTAPAFHLGGRTDLLLLRRRESDMAIGPFLAIESEALRTIAIEGGVEWLVPAWAGIPLVFAAGGYERDDSVHSYEPGVLGAVFWGPHSYNFEGAYALSGGLFVEGRRGLGGEHDLGIVAGVSFDVTLLAYPFIAAASALRSD